MFFWRTKSDSKRKKVIKLIAVSAQPRKLQVVDLSGLYLTCISLEKTNLTEAYLTFTYLSDAGLGAADLTSVKYNATIVQGTNLENIIERK